jgi:hypothetical protein
MKEMKEGKEVSKEIENKEGQMERTKRKTVMEDK